jgi:RHS repeat-associated protein
MAITPIHRGGYAQEISTGTASPSGRSAMEVSADERAQQRAAQGSDLNVPAITLPKGGGAIRGIGEKFAANPVNGSGSMSVPLALSPGRAGFGPQLELSYDSMSGNGLYGFGWSLGLPAITRKTDKGLPRYGDGEESDVFILPGAEDLVPVLDDAGKPTVDTTTAPGYRIHRYRPRTEGLFARIERWTKVGRPDDVHWRSLSRDNILTLYGQDSTSRVVDPADARRIFSWRICETRDATGNAVIYVYQEEDGANVDLGQAHERNRGDRNDKRRRVNGYLKRIYYGNRKPLLDSAGLRPRFLTPDEIEGAGWCFEVVFDYGEHDEHSPTPDPGKDKDWPCRTDPFSTYRSGFEVRTYRLCRRVLMFHHFEHEPGVGLRCLVRSTDLSYRETPVASFVTAITQRGYRHGDHGYIVRELPALEFTYSEAVIDETLHEAGPGTLEGLPVGVDGSAYRWVDLDGHGLSGVLTEQAGAWFYKPSLGHGLLGLPRTVARRPSLAALRGGRQQLLDLAGDGSLDLVELSGPAPGFYERTDDEDWESFRPFRALPNIGLDDPDVRFVDLDGDGRADAMITESDVITWYPSLGEDGFDEGLRIHGPHDEERGPHLVLADGTQQIHLADVSGDGLNDLVRIRNGEICYWPNLGYGRFGPKVAMDNAPVFDTPDQFDESRLRLADIDGSSNIDVIYLGRDGVRIYFNQSGNSWSDARRLSAFPPADNVTSVAVTDLLGNGTACLVWSSPLPHDAGRQLRYVDLMGGQKPHLLETAKNNLGTETHVHYVPSTQFFLRDRAAGQPWVTRLPFPVHVIERVETYDRISRNRFVTRYAYHHPHFDPVEREFQGFGLVEQWDTEQLAAFTKNGMLPAGENADAATHVPPVLTKTWFHTGLDAGMMHELFPGLLAGTVLPADLTVDEEREAWRALKGSMLRQEVYAEDGTANTGRPYTVTEASFAIRCLQRRQHARHAVFFVHPQETISHHYERQASDPRVTQTLTLEVDPFGNVLKQAAIAYGRDASPLAPELDGARQTTSLITYTESRFTDPVGGEDHRAPLPAESRTFELTGYAPGGDRFQPGDFVEPAPRDPARLRHIRDCEIGYEEQPTSGHERRLIEHARTLYRGDDLTGLLPLGTVGRLALPGETYKLAFTTGLLTQVFKRPRQNPPDEDLLPDPSAVLGGEGGYVQFDDRWWAPTGRVFLSASAADTPAKELAYAREHFFIGRRYHDPFGHDSTVEFDEHNLLLRETRDPVGNVVTADRDYRVLQPRLVTDANGNRVELAFDALGMVVGTAVMGKAGQGLGDSLAGFEPDLDEAVMIDHLETPLADPATILGQATTRLVYDVLAYQRTHAQPNPWPAAAYTLSRETHDASSKIQHALVYSDGLGREIQRKVQAEPESAGDPPRWVGSGWIIYNNKAMPVRRYEPFFSATHRFEFGVTIGVSPILFYDPLGRVVATLHPDNTYEKVVFNPWTQTTHDVNDTVAADPRADPDVGGFMAGYFATLPAAWQTWYMQRQGTAFGTEEQAAAAKAEIHAGTPATAHLDPLGRPFLTVARNCFVRNGAKVNEAYESRVELDIEGRPRAVRDPIVQDGDALGRVVMRYDYNLLGHPIRQASMDAGLRWMLAAVTGQAICGWDARGHSSRTEYDPARRPLRSFVTGADPANPARELLTERLVYGEQHPGALAANLRGRVCLHLDQAGAVTITGHDFKGNLLTSSRRIARLYTATFAWKAADAALPTDATVAFDPAALEAALAPVLEGETFTTSTSYDALNRARTVTTPDRSVVRPAYNEASLLERVDVNLRGVLSGGVPAWTPFVTDLDYDAKGQRTRIVYGSGAGNGRDGVTTTYEYDPLTFRLRRLTTKRDQTAFPADCPDPPRPGWPGCRLQDLHYTYDPAGHITHMADDAQQAIFFRNVRVEPSADYTYDALYRLIEATGREHLGQLGELIPHSASDSARMSLPHPDETTAVGGFTEYYLYDAVGNLLQMRHSGTGSAQAGWTRTYAYDEDSLTEGEKQNNRLSSTTLKPSPAERYRHDAHGKLVRMPHLGGADPVQNMHWDERDQLRQVDLAGGGTAYFVYDSAGQRVRKVWEKAPGLTEERLYLGGLEIFRRRNGTGQVQFERETLHITDDTRRIALVETRTIDRAGTDRSPVQLIRYQFANHLGSASLELDADAQIISYEEYSPYGSTTYQAVGGQKETPKRYRFTGKERDEESGLYYHGARYYAPWLGRWISYDPASGGPSPYVYVLDNPVSLVDPDGAAPKTVVVHMPPNTRIGGTVAHDVINPARAERINNLPGSYYQAQTEVPTGPYGSRTRGSANAGRMDLSVFAAGRGTHVNELKPMCTAARHTDQVFNYTQRADTGLSAKPDTLTPEIAREHPSINDPVQLENTEYLLRDSEVPGFTEYLEMERVEVKVPAAEYKPQLKGPSAAATASEMGPAEAPTGAAASAPTAGAAAEGAATGVSAPSAAAAAELGGVAPTTGRALSTWARAQASEMLAAGKFGFGIAGWWLAVRENSPHFWEGYYDTEDAELIYGIGSALHSIGIGHGSKKPPHMGGDPYEYFRGTRWENVDWNDVFQKMQEAKSAQQKR